jgi:hypothetical protein
MEFEKLSHELDRGMNPIDVALEVAGNGIR